jgi:glycerophosphoryl diester phosphodiesterase
MFFRFAALACVFVFLPALFLPPMSGATRIQVHGHRGARAVLPENTLPAFEHAISVGADVLELDLAVTKDNVLVASHDPVLNPKICQGPLSTRVIREMTLAELKRWDCGSLQNPDYPKQKTVPGTRVPTLDEVFALANKGDFQFNVETKIFADKPQHTPPPLEFSKLVLDAIRKHGLESRVIVQSFDFRTLKEMKRLAPEIRLSALYGMGIHSFAAIAAEAEAHIISPNYVLVTPGKVAAAQKAGYEVVPWTANTPRDWDALIQAKADAIITDNPAELIAYLKAKGLR